MKSVEEEARRRYTEMDGGSRPEWDQLGDVTKGVWIGYVNKDPNWPFKYSVPDKTLAHQVEAKQEIVERIEREEPVVDITAGTGKVMLPEPPLKPLTLAERRALKGLK